MIRKTTRLPTKTLKKNENETQKKNKQRIQIVTSF